MELAAPFGVAEASAQATRQKQESPLFRRIMPANRCFRAPLQAHGDEIEFDVDPAIELGSIVLALRFQLLQSGANGGALRHSLAMRASACTVTSLLTALPSGNAIAGASPSHGSRISR